MQTTILSSNNNFGFTFLEMVVSVGLVSLLIIGLVSMQNLIASTQEIITTSTQSYNEANIAIQVMSKELRNARTSTAGSYPLVLANDQEIVFYANVDADPEPERVRYYLASNQIKKGVIQPVGTTYPSNNEQVSLVISYIVNNAEPIFYYYNGDWPADTTNNPLGTPSRLTDTKLVRINVISNPDPSRPESEYQLETSAQIRNLKTNL